jgi:hypothetical protein
MSARSKASLCAGASSWCSHVANASRAPAAPIPSGSISGSSQQTDRSTSGHDVEVTLDGGGTCCSNKVTPMGGATCCLWRRVA